MSLTAGAGVAAYHSGVELGWFGSSCAAALGGAQDLESLREQLLATPIVPCDQVLWSFLSLSLADWNVIVSLLLTVYAGSVIHDSIKRKAPLGLSPAEWEALVMVVVAFQGWTMIHDSRTRQTIPPTPAA